MTVMSSIRILDPVLDTCTNLLSLLTTVLLSILGETRLTVVYYT